MKVGRPTDEPAAVWVPVGDLAVWKDNPRKNATAIGEVAESIKRFGFASPIIARKADGQVIAGHTRLAAAQKLGLDVVPVRYLDLDPTDARLLALADNKLGEIAEWDDEALSRVLAELEAEGAMLDGLGWSADDLAALLEAPPPGETSAGDGDVPEPQGDPESRVGEVYALGPHRLICGDCRDPEVLARLMGAERATVAFTSPPYASQREYDVTSGFKPIPADKFGGWFEAVQANVRASLAADGSWFVNIKAHCEDGSRSLYVLDLVIAHVRKWGWRFVDEFCWRNLSNGVPGTWPNRFKNAWEPVYHFSVGAPKFRADNVKALSDGFFSYGEAKDSTTGTPFPTGTKGKEGMALPSNVIEARAESAGLHSAPFPVGLPAFFVRAFSDPGDIILDPFMGSGTTIIAAAKHGRRGYGVEISPKYCDVIRQRWTAWAKANNIDPGEGALDAPTV